MWCLIIQASALFAIVISEVTTPGIERTVSDGVKSVEYNMVYGDQDIKVVNEAVSDMERSDKLKKLNLMEALPPLPPQDVKCLMSVDRYCSKEMGAIKSIIIQALKEDCKQCTIDQKEQAGRIVASMMAHDPTAWKMFLTRSALQFLPPKEVPKEKTIHFKNLGEPEEVASSRYRHTLPGFQVRVRRYVAEIVS